MWMRYIISFRTMKIFLQVNETQEQPCPLERAADDEQMTRF